jgi:hypothetical protein
MNAPFNVAAESRYPTLQNFESGNVNAEEFDHTAHVYIAWKMLQESNPLETINRYSAALRRITAALNVPGKYHETITWFYVLIIADRISPASPGNWEQFAASNPDLLGNSMHLLSSYYSDERLWSADARQRFLLPDRAKAA